jgi:hypothetical protein
MIGDASAAPLVADLSALAALQMLSLTGNVIGDAGAIAVAGAATRLAALKTLYLDENRVTDACQAAVKRLLPGTALKF